MTEIVSTSLLLNRSEIGNHVSFWHYVAEHLTKHEYERYLLLKQVRKFMFYHLFLSSVNNKAFALFGNEDITKSDSNLLSTTAGMD